MQSNVASLCLVVFRMSLFPPSSGSKQFKKSVTRGTEFLRHTDNLYNRYDFTLQETYAFLNTVARTLTLNFNFNFYLAPKVKEQSNYEHMCMCLC